MPPRRPDPGPGQALGRALLALAEQRRRPPCGEEPGLWMSEAFIDKRAAARRCDPCPIRGECLDAAVTERTTFSVRAGHDFGVADGRRAARTEHLQRKAAA